HCANSCVVTQMSCAVGWFNTGYAAASPRPEAVGGMVCNCSQLSGTPMLQTGPIVKPGNIFALVISQHAVPVVKGSVSGVPRCAGGWAWGQKVEKLPPAPGVVPIPGLSNASTDPGGRDPMTVAMPGPAMPELPPAS